MTAVRLHINTATKHTKLTSDIMESRNKAEFEGFLKILPPVEFACLYGSSLLPTNKDKSTMTDYILGVADPQQWHSETLKVNKNHYASWIAHLVHIVVDNLDIENINSVNLRSALSVALLLLPLEFTEEDLYAKVCSLSYVCDLRMLFAQDKNKVKKIVRGQFDLFHTMYKPFLEEYEAMKLLRFSQAANHQIQVFQD
ncbi:hypothetical protein L6164_035381 [Bauhinia variegata]|uniref:Uncharacterized protein n=1 Tax=Bauhinia variegata TaxID=167791 RepID=A0ACB9KDU0_BAUVA|nr:hypothetical protein L6164_035381 [Bauhinia variegata]